MSGPGRQPIDARLEPAVDEAEAARIWQRVREAQAARRRGRRWPVLALATAGLAAVMLVVWLAARSGGAGSAGRAAGPLVGEVALDPGAKVGGGPARAVAMADGSRVELDRDTELEVLANEGDKFVTAVRRGRAHFDVRPGGPRRWVIETDLATVEVVGTAFAVDRHATGLTVTVERGVVLVRGERVPGRVVRLTAGQHVDVAPEAQTAMALVPPSPPRSLAPPLSPSPALQPSPAPAPSPSPQPSLSTSLQPSPSTAPSPSRSTTTSTSRSTSTAADGADGPDAADAERAADAKADGAVSIAAADAKIAAGDPAGAARILDDYLAVASPDATAGLAAFLVGRLAQDSLGDPDRAAAAFARVLAIGSPRAVQAEALARRASALARAGRRDQAREAARAYLARYPAGDRAAAMSELAAP